MSKTLIHEFDPVIYPYKIWVMIGGLDMVSSNFLHYNGEKIVDLEDRAKMLDGFSMQVENIENRKFGSLIWFSSKKSMEASTVAHEASHAAKQLFEHIDADVRVHEPFEYLLGWIVKCCGDTLKYKPKKKEDGENKG